MKVVEILAALAKKDIRLWVEDGKLGFSAPEGAMTAEVKQQIVANKPAIIEFLGQAQASEQADIPLLERGGAHKLSYAQQRFWFLNQLEPDSSAYNMVGALRIQGNLQQAILQRALSEICRRHEILRTTYQVDGDICLQHIGEAREFALELEQLTLDPEQSIEQQIEAKALELAGHGFDISREVFRVHLLQIQPNDYLLVTTLHHIASDGWSMGILVKELAALYSAYSQSPSQNPASPLPELKVQYADFAQWQLDQLGPEAIEADLSYWRKHLQHVPKLALATDYPRPAIAGAEGGSVIFSLDKQQTQGIKQLAQKQGVTLFMALQAAYKVLLARYSGNEDICVGTPIAGRDHSALEELIGCFLNTLAIRTDLSGNPSFIELLAREKDVTQAAFKHQNTPFAQVVEALDQSRDMSTTPVFQTLFVLQNAPVDRSIGLAGINITPLELEKSNAQFELKLSLNEADEEFVGEFEYRSDLFSKTSVERLAAHFSQLLSSLIAKPEQGINQAAMISSAEVQQLLSTEATSFNATRVDYGQPQAINVLVEQQVAKTPDALAVADQQHSLSYQELNSRANQLAHYLIAQGLQAEQSVAVCMQRSVDMSVALLAVLKAGGCYLPCDPGFPHDRLAFMLEDSQAFCILSQSHLSDTTAAINQTANLPIYALEQDQVWQNQSTANPGLNQPSESLFNIIYTSGSTGKPKGVLVPHAGIYNRIQWMQAEYQLNAGDKVLQKTPYSFDVSVWEFFWPLITGASLIYAKPDGHKDPEYLRDIIQQQGISHLHFVPSMLAVFLQTQGIEQCQSIKQVFCSGEALQLEHEKRFFQQLSFAELHNLYGPTEASVDVSYYACSGRENYASVPIGKPVANTQLHVLDQHLQVVPIGVPGELYIGGVQLARGYLNRDELNKTTFIDNPYAKSHQHPSPRLYKTGDLVRFLDNGEIEYIGRVDHQVKIRGLRIELGEIEAQLNQLKRVGESVVVAQSASNGDKHLVAYIVLSDGIEDGFKDKAQQALAEHLPEYMVPKYFVFMDEFPLSANGKLNRKALPLPEFKQQSAQYIAPQTELEQQLAEIWQDLLGVERVGLADNFFELGGHSLLATQLIARLRQQLKQELPLKALFGTPTLQALAQALDGATAGNSLDLGAIKQLRQQQEQLPLSFAQQRLWLIDQLQPGSAMYNIPLAVKLDGPLNIQALEQALQALMDQHPSLRTRFARPSPQEPALQIIAEQQAFELEQQSASNDNWQDLAQAFLSQGFDLQQGPLIRAELLTLAPEQAVLLISQHHIISDGWSQQLMIEQLGQAYMAYQQGQQPDFAPAVLDYADYALWQQDYLQGEVLEQQIAYWQQHLANSQVLELPTDFQRPAVLDASGESLGLVIPEDLAERLRSLAQANGATLYMTLMAAWQLLLSRLSGQSDISVGSPVAGRQHGEFESILGFFVNTLVMRNQLTPQLSFEQLLAQVKTNALAAYEHQDLPFERLVDELKLPRDLSHTPLFQVLFVLQNEQASQGAIDLGGLKLEPAIDEQQNRATAAKFDLSLTLTDSGSGAIKGSLEYRTSLWQQASINALLEHFLRLLSQVCAKPETQIGFYSLLSEAEIEQQTQLDNQTQVNFGAANILDLFEAQVAQTPDNIAAITAQIDGGGEQLSYAELNRQANQLARLLQQKGVQSGQRIGVCLRPCNQSLVAVLGIIKAGAAYVPMDASYPIERLRHIGEQSQCQLIISHSDLAAQLPDSSQALYLDQAQAELAACSGENLNLDIAADDMLYAVFTSGSTGLPKGAAVTHANEANLIHWYRQEYNFSAADKAFVISAFGFDLTQKNLFALLTVGGSVVFPAQAFYDPASLLKTVAEQQISLINCAPSAFYPLLEQPSASDDNYAQLRSLRCVLFGGEPINLAAMQDWLEHSACHVVNMYGPTECTDIAASYTLSEPLKAVGKTIPIGKPNANVSLYILDQQQQLLPQGYIGELCIGGAGVGLGYINNAEQTAEKFLPNPFAKGRIYRTGDLVRKRSDGNIEFISRIDNQVKVRGYRIELGEIEAVLNQFDWVQQAAVIVHKGSAQDFIVAYLACEREIDQLELKQALRAHLPDYMVPSLFIGLEQIPLSPNGKLDYKALPDPQQQLNNRSDYQAPTTELEQQLADIWQQVLGLEKVGISDNFFELGGNSLSASQTISQVQAQFQLEIELRSLFDEPTIAALAKLIEQAQLEQSLVLDTDSELDDDEEEFVL